MSVFFIKRTSALFPTEDTQEYANTYLYYTLNNTLEYIKYFKMVC